MAIYARFTLGNSPDNKASYGIVNNRMIEELNGGLFDTPVPSGRQFALTDVTLLCPCEPGKVLAVGLNYKSHLGTRPAPANPEIFYKPVSCLQNPEGPIRIPAESEDAHFEGELVVVVGKTLKDASREEAAAAVFGVTCGNDVSDRNWQRGPNADRQWWRAKGCDTFGPLGPWIVTGLEYGDLALQTRVNGEVLQEQRTSDLLFDVPDTLSFVSRFVTLNPGDVLFTGTPGNTKKMKPGDVVEIELEGIGILRNPVVCSPGV